MIYIHSVHNVYTEKKYIRDVYTYILSKHKLKYSWNQEENREKGNSN